MPTVDCTPSLVIRPCALHVGDGLQLLVRFCCQQRDPLLDRELDSATGPGFGRRRSSPRDGHRFDALVPVLRFEHK
jgi:hypothetical protein